MRRFARSSDEITVKLYLRPLVGFVFLLLVAAALGSYRLILVGKSTRQNGSGPTGSSSMPDTPGTQHNAAPSSDADNYSAANALPQADRKYIWDIEHVALVLDVHLFPKIARAIREQDPAGLRSFLSDGFSGSVPNFDNAETVRYPFGEFRKTQEQQAAEDPMDSAQFVAFLLAQHAKFRQPPKVEMRLMRLSPAERSDLDKPWHGTTKIRLAGEQPNGQPLELELQGHFTLQTPVDDLENRNGWLKSCTLTAGRVNSASRQLMAEVGAERGIDRKRFHDNWNDPDKPPIVARGGVNVCDYDRDGRMDVLVTDDNEIVLYQGQSDGNFRDATGAAGLTGTVRRTSAPATFADFDGDGYEDLLVGEQLFRNNRDATFTDVTLLGNFRLPPDLGGFAVADYDLDGKVDLYVVRASRGPAGQSRVSWVDDQSGPGNQLWRNLGNWQFRNVTATTNSSAGHKSCFAAVWLDANGDGWPDLAVADEFGSSVLLVNQRDGRFAERPLKKPFAGFCMGIAAGDFDNDGRSDVYLANMYSKAGDRIIANLPDDAYTPAVRAKIKEFVIGSELLRNKGDLNFEPMGRRMGVNGVGWAYGTCTVDLNNDGWLDIYATAGFLSYTRGEPDG
jgi:hypothetical protein